MTDSFNWSNYIIPPIFVGISVLIKDAYVDGYSIKDAVVLTDVGVHIVAYLLSDVIVQFGINKMFDNSQGESLLRAGSDIVIQPGIHGLMTGLVRPMIHSEATLLNHPITFANSAIDGIVYNIVAKYLSSPLIVYLSK